MFATRSLVRARLSPLPFPLWRCARFARLRVLFSPRRRVKRRHRLKSPGASSSVRRVKWCVRHRASGTGSSRSPNETAIREERVGVDGVGVPDSQSRYDVVKTFLAITARAFYYSSSSLANGMKRRILLVAQSDGITFFSLVIISCSFLLLVKAREPREARQTRSQHFTLNSKQGD